MQCMSKREGIRKFSSYPAINLIIFLLVYLLCLSFFPPMGICMSASLPNLLAFCMPDCISFGLFECLVVWLCLSVSDCLSVCMLSVHLPAFCQSIFLSRVFKADVLSTVRTFWNLPSLSHHLKVNSIFFVFLFNYFRVFNMIYCTISNQLPAVPWSLL